ncbi:6-carboxytetrahydropterin synthase QueD [bacterium endosymbiont of Bathymodiolus sp. 5 South]|jgi:6-pyruvoyltetrahydropterin/6-carboxytetrahydropterin synthase|uniref:6-carboxytetrahydropterin synthase QueD n=1 Tax=bacterium endosymbiont of Bathymodiolus sp. 5 South TaxID=1181670 RepID=UPI0010B60C6B|nr:6-carboxytetrahydropterin synthase QueD [bacterium endosymbiont of Bathymodiolus sp. 5 South]CAC9464430.1 6-pyruvoyl tetrahydrobiopterin synthase (EC 4.2.3.12) [uncultured Gammaproteobacteria bacterium]SHN92282.1 6-pyruvoyl tetrahydrobiopterin synthase [bacterium endosymbiont of Bathymodiolus sp. 5 South]VVH59922.1 6-pyruvoyl tetrahydrobiopterin synthase (EC [uncultured Gammaproteobacteria bacterium]VVH61861.1 6-pyruvoyl tetrahydrobiopterin synthase (EC [uncultured Gammaproteobacteria bacter
MFVLKIVTDFASAHSLRDYPGDCSRLHGHNWQVEVSVESAVLDALGIAIDFREIKKQTKEVVKRLDHQYLNEIPPFDELNPTAENIAKYFYQEVGVLINNQDVRVCEVIIWETPRASVTYSEPRL